MASDLRVYQDGQGRCLMDWIRDKGETVYKDIGKKTWRIPPVKFNMQKLSEQKGKKVENRDFRIDGKILGQLSGTDQQTNRAENIVCSAFESLSNHFIETGKSPAMFLITNFEYDNYLNKLSHFITATNQRDLTSEPSENVSLESKSSPETTQNSGPTFKLPKDVTKRGELDILILHQQAGVMLVQTKSVGYNFFDESPTFERSASVATAVEKACEQLSRDRGVMLYIMDDLGLKDEQILAVVALPNLPRDILEKEMSSDLRDKIINEYKLSIENNFLCAEDLKQDMSGHFNILEQKWTNSLLPLAQGLDLETMQQIAYRTVGLLSTVSVWSYAQPRMEVRNWNDAAWETGNRYTQVVLSPLQVELLKREDQYLYLCGPAGSGKTLLLSLKGRQWLRRDCNVAVLNTRLGSRGRTVGQVIENTINRTKGLKKEAIRVDLDLSESEEVLESILLDQVKDQSINFLLDEVAWLEETEKLLAVVRRLFPNSSIWCAGMLVECQPKGFDTGTIQVILRCPPSVQRVLRLVDNRDERCEQYILDSVKAGLPTDGLPAYFIIHSEHGDSSIQPYDCPLCAKKLADFLINQLNLKGGATDRISTNEMMTCDTAQKNFNQSLHCISKLPCGRTVIGQSSCSDFPSFGSSVGSDSGCDMDYNSRDSFCSETSDDVAASPHNKQGTQLTDTRKNKPGRKQPRRGKQKHQNNENSGNSKSSVYSDQESHSSLADVNSFTASDLNANSKIYHHDNSLSVNKLNQDKACKLDSTCSSIKATASTRSNKKSNCSAASSNCSDQTIANPCLNYPSQDNNANTACSSEKKNKRGGRKTKRDSNNNGLADTSIDKNSVENPRLSFSDAVLPVTVPRAWHHYNKRGYWSLTREALAQEMILLGSGAFSQALYDSGVPVKVEEQMVMKAEEKQMENHFVICPVGAVHGLEYKLVICVPSACSLPEYTEISEGIRNGSMEPKALMKRTNFAEEYLKRRDELELKEDTCPMSDGKTGPKIDKVRISTHVAEKGAPYDILYVPATDEDHRLFYEMKQRNMKTKKDSPETYKAPVYTDEEIKKVKDELCRHCDTDRCVCKFFRPQELVAVQRLSAWNKAYVLMCASRCTSTLVLVLP